MSSQNKTYVIILLSIIVVILGLYAFNKKDDGESAILAQSQIQDTKTRALQTLDSTVEEADFKIVEDVDGIPSHTNEEVGETIEETIDEIDEIVQDAVEDINETAIEAAEEVKEEVE